MSNILGTHKARLNAAAPCFTKTGKRQLEVEFEIVEGELKGSYVGDFWSAEGKARPFIAGALKLCGWDGGKSLLPSAGKNVVEINIYEEEYRGNKNQRIRVNRPRTVLKTKSGLQSKSEDRLDPEQADNLLADIAADSDENLHEDSPPMREMGDDDDLR
jgi:hypothetical protein